MQNIQNLLFCGIDTHKDFHQAVVIDCFNQEIKSFKVDNTKKDIKSFSKKAKKLAQREDKIVAFGIEGGFHLGWLLSQILVKEFKLVYEINSIYTKDKRFSSTNWTKSDKRDAELLASILKDNLKDLPKMSRKHTHNKTFKKLKNLLYMWDSLTDDTSSAKNQLHHLLFQHDTQYKEKYKDITSKKTLNRLIRSFSHKKGTIPNHIVWKAKTIKRTQSKKKKLKKKVRKELDSLPWRLETLPGVGPVNALAILATTHGGKKFSNIWKFKRYVGCVPEKHQSGNNTKAKSSKMSQKRLYKAIYSIALTQIRIEEKAKQYYQKKLSEGKNKKQARRALMNRISSIVYGMLRTKTKYKG